MLGSLDEGGNFSGGSIGGFGTGAAEQCVGDGEVVAGGEAAQVVVVGDEDAAFGRNGGKGLAGPLVEGFQFFLVGGGVGAVNGGVGGIGSGEFFGQQLGHGNDLEGIHPEVGIGDGPRCFSHVGGIGGMGMGGAFAKGRGVFGEQVLAEVEGFALKGGSGKQSGQPVLKGGADADDGRRLVQFCDVGRRGVVGVQVGVDWKQRRYLNVSAADGVCPVGWDGEGGDDVQRGLLAAKQGWAEKEGGE